MKIIDYTGQTINGATVLQKTDLRTKAGLWIYEVMCACGAIHQRSTEQLRRGGKIKACECYKAHNAKPDSIRHKKGRFKDWHLQKTYGITLDEYYQMLDEQDGTCAICDALPPTGRKKYLAVDHDHQTGKVRGLLCDNCNRAIGLLKDDAEVLNKASQYLIKHTNAR